MCGVMHSTKWHEDENYNKKRNREKNKGISGARLWEKATENTHS